MAILKEVVCIIGKYTDKNGQEKNQYLNIGKVIETKTGSQMIKLDSIPVGFDGWAYLNDPRPRDDNKGNSAPQNDAPFDDSDSIPF